MERLTYRKRNVLGVAALSVTALAGCSIDSYHNDASNVQCDGKRTKTNLQGNGMATFIVHGEDDSIATVQVRRSEQGVSVGVTGDISGRPPQVLEADGFTVPIPQVNGPELSTYGAGGAWIIDARDDSIVIQGSCDGL